MTFLILPGSCWANIWSLLRCICFYPCWLVSVVLTLSTFLCPIGRGECCGRRGHCSGTTGGALQVSSDWTIGATTQRPTNQKKPNGNDKNMHVSAFAPPLWQTLVCMAVDRTVLICYWPCVTDQLLIRRVPVLMYAIHPWEITDSVSVTSKICYIENPWCLVFLYGIYIYTHINV